ncbi:zinc-binding dehydrogenase [Staphylococcus sp. ZWU0021]|uniref:zinc-binding dehydrogenase n=1 Tax=Staphylococcus sp. ZWU0021 TaxID=1339238 RepID=UPI0022B17FFF|nr:zinc-binding dehydrogenase [Staphylococcus sp. ZWU0021]
MTAYFTWTELNRQDLIEVVNLYGYGVVKAYFEAIFPLSFVREAHKLSENGHSRGKIVINNKS